MLELTDNPEIILPGMLAVVISGITASEVFGKESLFITMLRANGLDYGVNPMTQALRRVGVASVMDRNFARVGSVIGLSVAREVLGPNPLYLVVEPKDGPRLLMPAVDLARHLESMEDADADAGSIDLLEIPAQRMELGRINLQANLQEAWEMFDRGEAEALVVERMTAPGIYRSYGVLTHETAEKAYRY
jgi:CIC family chloride channel protein